jgi:putative ABC transport system ATP-binding protein
MMATPLVVENLTKKYSQGERTVVALAGVSLSVERGRLVAVMGASGSGKSTLLHLMAGLAAPDAGRILVDGRDIAAMGDRELTLFRRRHIGLVFQAFNLIPTLTARENIGLPLMLEGRNGRELAQTVDRLLAMLGLGDRSEHRPDVMSGGEQQRVAIGRALVGDPAVILADEPTGNLDSVSSREMCELLRSLCREQGRTIVMVTHEPAVAAFAEEVQVMRDGRIVGSFEPGKFGGAPELTLEYQRQLRCGVAAAGAG